jgi:uncharacterized protein YkwD
MVLPTSTIMNASGQSTDNSDGSSTDGSTTDNSGSTTNDNSRSSTIGGGTTTDNSTTLPTTSTASNSTGNTQQQSNSTTLPTTSTASNSTGNTQQQIKDNLDDFRLILQDQHFSQGINNTKIPPYCSSCDDNIYLGTGDYASMILAGHNRERAAVGVAPLVWSNELASRAQDWVNYNIAHGLFTHCVFVPGNQQIEPCKYEDGENSAARNHCVHTGTCDPWKVPPAQMQEMWFAENPTDHWLQVVSKTATSIGCAYATGPSKDGGDRDLMYCRYSPAGLDVPGMICGGTCTEIKSP